MTRILRHARFAGDRSDVRQRHRPCPGDGPAGGLGKGDAAYVGLQAAVAIIAAMIQGEGPSSDIAPAVNRLIGVFGGIAVVSICHPLLAPPVRRVIDPRPLIRGE